MIFPQSITKVSNGSNNKKEKEKSKYNYYKLSKQLV